MRSDDLSSKVALGTAQFGVPYGIANSTGQVRPMEVARILSAARTRGVDTLDTAITYGTSERVLGASGLDGFEVVTKLPALPGSLRGSEIVEWVTQKVRTSRRDLRVGRLNGILLHRPDDLFGAQGEALFASMRAVRESGLCSSIGVSVYEPQQLDRLIPFMPFDLVQLPFNVLDNRMSESGWLDRLAEAGTLVHARSAFLQGLLLLAPADRPEHFLRWQYLWDAWDAFLLSAGRSPLDVCLSHAIMEPRISRIVVGVDSLSHLTQILDIAASATPVDLPAGVRSVDSDLLDPSRWAA